MKFYKSDVVNAIRRKNEYRGILEPAWNVPGSVMLTGDIAGMGVEIITNTHGGAETVIYGATKKEAFYAVNAISNETITDSDKRNAVYIIKKTGGYREKWFLENPCKIGRTETWNDEHRVVEFVADETDSDGHQDSISVDLVTGYIVG